MRSPSRQHHQVPSKMTIAWAEGASYYSQAGLSPAAKCSSEDKGTLNTRPSLQRADNDAFILCAVRSFASLPCCQEEKCNPVSPETALNGVAAVYKGKNPLLAPKQPQPCTSKQKNEAPGEYQWAWHCLPADSLSFHLDLTDGQGG